MVRGPLPERNGEEEEGEATQDVPSVKFTDGNTVPDILLLVS